MKKSEVEYNRRRLLHKAAEYAKTRICECGKKDWKVVDLYEYGDPFLPSTVLIVCKKCNRKEIFASADIESAKAYAREIKASGAEIADEGAADRLIK